MKTIPTTSRFHMHESERVKLIGGPYRMPRCRIGGTLRCAVRGKVIVRGITDDRIMWPYTWIRDDDHRPAPILCGDLARAVRTESAAAVQHWWGVSVYYSTLWRRTLGVEYVNKGTSELLSRWAPESIGTERAKRRQARTLTDPERGAKIAAALRGRKHPFHVVAAIRHALKGRKKSAAARAHMSEAHKRRGTWPPCAGPPWTSGEESLLGKMRDCEVAEKTGRSLSAVRFRRRARKIAPYAMRYQERGSS